MISPPEADTIKQILGTNYAKKILQFLEDEGLTRESGKNYERADVYQVMNSNRENEDMENAIFKLVTITKQRKQEALERRQAILR